MSTKGIRKTKSGSWEATIQSPLLARKVSRNFDSLEEASRYKARMLEIMAGGSVPAELITSQSVRALHAPPARRRVKPQAPVAPARPGQVKIAFMLEEYLASDSAKIAKSDRPVVEALSKRLQGGVSGINANWCDAWVRHMKREERLAPGTIRKKVEALARAIDWWYRRENPVDAAPANMLRTLPRGYSTYHADDVRPGDDVPEDKARDRRLGDFEQATIERVILGEARKDRERPWGKEDDRQDFLAMFRLIVSTGVRLREAYRVRVCDVKPGLRTLHIPRSKTGRARDVPMTRQVEGWLVAQAAGKAPTDPIFPFWGGSEDEDVLRQTTNRLSKRFATLFEYSGCHDLTEHDLRHEAVCRWMLLRGQDGRFIYRPEEVRRITGHKNVQQFERYLSLRGSDLADRLED